MPAIDQLSSDRHHRTCLPWLWPLCVYENLLDRFPFTKLGAELPLNPLGVPRDLMHFAAEAHKIDFELRPVWATPHKIKLDLKTMWLRDFSSSSRTAQNFPVIIDAPYAGHSATIADYSADQSLVRTLQEYGLPRVYVTDWKSATPAMANYTIDTYVKDLDAAVDAVGGKAHLVGICQGGWMSAAYAARFPQKVSTLVLGGAPIDTDAGAGVVKRLAHTLPMSLYRSLVRAGHGRLLGKIMLASWKSMNPTDRYVTKYADLFTHINDRDYIERAEEFARWYEAPLDLPGKYYLQAVEWLFKENRLVKGGFTVLGKAISLKDVTIPVYMLAGEEDDITPPEQVFNASLYLGTPPEHMAKKLVPGGHIGLFMGHATLQHTWPEICRWILSFDAEAQRVAA